MRYRKEVSSMFQIKKKAETVNVTIRVPVPLLEELKAYAQSNGISFNALAVQIFNYVMDEVKKQET